jgi:hypothetical protein
MDILIGILAVAIFGGFIYRIIDLNKKGLSPADFFKFSKTEPSPPKDALGELSKKLKENSKK